MKRSVDWTEVFIKLFISCFTYPNIKVHKSSPGVMNLFQSSNARPDEMLRNAEPEGGGNNEMIG